MTSTSLISRSLVDVGEWEVTRYQETGAADKVTLYEPTSRRRHIFKCPNDRQSHYIWSELLASYIAGDLLGWEVQSVGVAVRGRRYGSLLAYIYNPDDEDRSEVLEAGADYCEKVDPHFNAVKNTRYTLGLLRHVCDHLERCHGLAADDFWDFWGRAFALDSLISNTDRHAENWSVIRSSGTVRMAALYDNAASLGCGIERIGLGRAFDANGMIRDEHLNRIRRKGRHSVSVDGASGRGSPFDEINAAFLDMHPRARVWFEAVEAVEIERIREMMATLCTEINLEEPHALSERRQRHVFAMLQIGRERIIKALQGGQLDAY